MKRTKIEIIPMIDTMFFLLVFFMLSSLSLTNLMGMPVNLPKSSNSLKQNKLDFTVSVDKSGNVFVNKTPVSPDDVGNELLTLAGGPKADLSEASVVINADEGVPYGLVIRCIDQARGVGVTHFPLATSPQDVKGKT
ncbi:MAG: biopolymer transporter ExbD [Fimbriimonas sp.]|nr:biopolymer transporter ExbD [Fimbriimonas sp.]